MITRRKILNMAVSLLAVFSLPALADIYKCTGESGQVTYTNVTKKGCTKLNLDPVSTVPTYKGKSDASFPKVNGDTQKKRDTDRRKILEQELAAEEKALAEAKRELAEAESDPEVSQIKTTRTIVIGKNKDGSPITQTVTDSKTHRNVAAFEEKIKPLQDNVQLHERNIEALKREIGNLK